MVASLPVFKADSLEIGFFRAGQREIGTDCIRDVSAPCDFEGEDVEDV